MTNGRSTWGAHAALAFMVVVLAAATGCSYAGAAAISNDRVVITRNDNFLFGALRTVYVCKVTDTGLADCQEGESP